MTTPAPSHLRDIDFERALAVSSAFGMVYSCLYDGQVSEAVGLNSECAETLPNVAGPHGDVPQQSQSNSPKFPSEGVYVCVAKYLIGDAPAIIFMHLVQDV